MCHKRCVPALDNYWESLQSVIWPRFEQIFRQNIQSIRECDPTKFNKEMGPHYVSSFFFKKLILSVLVQTL